LTGFVLQRAVAGRVVGERVAVGVRAGAVFAGQLVGAVVTPGDAAAVRLQDGRAVARLVVGVVEAGDRRTVTLDVGQPGEVAGVIVAERGPGAVSQLLERSAAIVIVGIRRPLVL